jgi:hypothetical protein
MGYLSTSYHLDGQQEPASDCAPAAPSYTRSTALQRTNSSRLLFTTQRQAFNENYQELLTLHRKSRDQVYSECKMPWLVKSIESARSKPAIASLALITHYILHSGEWDNHFHVVLGVWTVAFSGLATAEFAADGGISSLVGIVETTTNAAMVYFSVLIASILLHRGFYHRLSKV